jgi:type IV pilus assembly protein PilC
MNKYKYKAINENGRYVTGTITADNPADLASMIKSSELEIVSYKIENAKGSIFSGNISTKDIISMFIHLEQLDKAGVPIIDSISDLKESSDSFKIKNLMHEVHESIKKGSLLSESLAKHPKVFSPTYVGLINSGEKTGNLGNAFNSIIEDLKWNIEIKRKAKKATVGPLFGVIVAFLVLAVMMGVVVPKVTGFLATQSIKLPVATTSLIAFSHFAQNYWYILIGFLPSIMMLMKVLGRVPDLAIVIDDLKLKAPIIGPILSKLDSARFCQFFSMTFKSGLGVIECLDSAGMVIKNAAIKKSILVVKQQVSDGKSLAKAIASTGYFPNLVVRMFKIGEDSGNMESALLNIKFFYDREINDSIDKLVGMIQPTLTFIIGGMVAWVTVGVFGPIYGSFGSIK